MKEGGIDETENVSMKWKTGGLEYWMGIRSR